MATASLNATASEFMPQVTQSQAASSPDEARERRTRGPRSKSKKKKNADAGEGSDTTSPPPAPAPRQQQRQQQRNGESSSMSLVPASVQRRRQPANGARQASSTTTPSSDGAQAKPKKTAAKRTTHKDDAIQSHAEEEEEAECCLLCADPIQFHAVGECNHHGICSKCSLRMRMLMKDRSCPICKQNLERVVVSREKRNFESFQLWGDAAAGGRESVMDDASEIIFYECRAHYTALRGLRDFACRMKKCKAVCGSLPKLKDHLRIEHATELCELCVAHQHFFIQEHQAFTKTGLRAHNIGKNKSIGPKSSGKDFHPMCQFCKRRFYSDMQLYEHLERDHFRCHICKIDHDYFRNYSSLEAHFRREHHLCEDPHCLENRYVVFPNDIEYHAHMRSIHGVLNRMVLNFQVARSGENPLGGAAASGAQTEDVPDSWSFNATDGAPAAVAATPNQRRLGARTRHEAAFPALPTPAGPAPPPLAQPAISATRGAAPLARTSSAPSFTARSNTGRTSSSSTPAAGGGRDSPPRTQYLRNQRLAEALGLARAGESPQVFENEMKMPNYPTHLVDWGKANLGYLQVVERRLERIVEDASCHSVSLRPMPSEERKLMHELAAFYGVPSESFGEDPFRRISFFKKDDAQVPEMTLSKVLRGSAMAARTTSAAASASRLSFLPLRGSQPPAPQAAAAAPRPQPSSGGISRGWEKIQPKPKRPVVADAWSDDEDEAQTATTATQLQQQHHDDNEDDEEQKL